MALQKKGYILSYMDFFRGIAIGLLIGGVLVYLVMSGIIPINLGKK